MLLHANAQLSTGFFSEILVLDGDNVPEDGPLIVCCTHWNMIASCRQATWRITGSDGCVASLLRPGHQLPIRYGYNNRSMYVAPLLLGAVMVNKRLTLAQWLQPAVLSAFFPHDRMLH